MNNILLKVQQYLDLASRKPVELDKQLVQKFGEACKNALLKQFQGERRTKFEPRMSSIGSHYANYKWKLKVLKVRGNPIMLR